MPAHVDASAILVAETKRQYHNNPITHAIAKLVVNTLDNEHHERMGTGLGRHEREIAKMSAAMGVVLAAKDADGTPTIERLIMEAGEAANARLAAELLP